MSATSDLHQRLVAFAQEALFILCTEDNHDKLLQRLITDGTERDLLTLHHSTGLPQLAPELDGLDLDEEDTASQELIFNLIA